MLILQEEVWNVGNMVQLLQCLAFGGNVSGSSPTASDRASTEFWNGTVLGLK